MCVLIRIASMRRFFWEHTTYLHIKESRKYIAIKPPDLALWLTVISSNYLCLEHIFMVPKLFEPLKFHCTYFSLYTQQQKKRENLFLLNWLKIKYVEFQKYIFHVKLNVYYTVCFTCNIYFLNSAYCTFNQFKSNKLSRRATYRSR